MNHRLSPLAVVCLALAGGCASTPPAHFHGNPFDEPERPAVRPAPSPVPDPVRASAAPLSPPRIWVSVADTHDVPADPLVFAVGQESAPVDTLQESMEDPAGRGLTGRGDEVFDEAMRIGAAGDVQGQLELLAISSGRGNPEALYELARIYLNGAGVSKAPDTAIAYLNQAMGMGHVESSRVLGWLYVMGTGVDRDLEYGRLLLDKAAQTSVRAQREYGMALANLREPNLDDFEQGLELLQSAASSGDEQAEAAYQALLSVGPGDVAHVTAPMRDDDLEPFSLKERALKGDVAAMYEFALNVSLGKIPDSNPEFTAYCWYSVAASRGHARAALETQSLSGVRALADRAEPGATDRAIDAINARISGG